jgi:DNA-directed RNA polymerase subunit L
MKVKILSEAANRLEIEIADEDHTLGNLLRSKLLKDKKVKHAGYQIVHPLTGGIKLLIQTEGSATPRDALLRALSEIEEETKDFQQKFKKAV